MRLFWKRKKSEERHGDIDAPSIVDEGEQPSLALGSANVLDTILQPYGPIMALRWLGRGHTLRLDPDAKVQVIGRRGPPDCNLQLRHPSVSRVHAQIVHAGTHITIRDLNSTCGVRVPVNYSREDYTLVRRGDVDIRVGERFALGDAQLLALDEPTSQLTRVLENHCGFVWHGDIDQGLEAVALAKMLILHGEDRDTLLQCARTLHAGSRRRDLPFVVVSEMPVSAEQGESLCAAARCGTIFLDLMRPRTIPPHLASRLCALQQPNWTIVATAAPALRDVGACFGGVLAEATAAGLTPVALGFPKKGWRPATVPGADN